MSDIKYEIRIVGNTITIMNDFDDGYTVVKYVEDPGFEGHPIKIETQEDGADEIDRWYFTVEESKLLVRALNALIKHADGIPALKKELDDA